jgi:PadR family transcriptional regulator AphA
VSRKTSTDFAILGLLTVEPMSGYDIRKHFSESLVYLWNESYGQIYPALKRLADAGLIAPVAAGQSGKRERQVYALKSKGRERLRQWLALPPQQQPVRNELQLKLFLGHSAPAESLLEHIGRFRREQEELLAMHFIIRDSIRVEHAKSPHLTYWLLGLSHGIRKCRAEIDWCNEALRVCGLLAAPEK